MYCPRCKNQFICPCSSCDPESHVFLWSISDDGNGSQCNVCGLSEDESWWLDVEVHQLCEKTGTNNLTDALKVLEYRKSIENVNRA